MPNFQLNGKKIHYETYGETGPPIVLLNGIMMSTASWQMFIPTLSANNRLILVDFFDQGQSEKMAGEEYTLDLQVEVVKKLLQHLGLEKAGIAGVSYGGNTALKFAATHPEMVERLLIFHAAPKTSNWLKDVGKSWISAMYSPEAFYNTAIPVIYSPNFYNSNPEWVKTRKEFLTTQIFTNKEFMEAVERLTNSSHNYDVTGVLGDITAKTMIVAAEFDPLTPASDQRQLAEGIKDAELLFLPDVGHASMYEKPAIFASLMVGFFNYTL